MRKKMYFGNDHEIMYGTVYNHDAYAHLHITLEIQPGNTESIVLFNHKEVGKVEMIPMKKSVVYVPYRKVGNKFVQHLPKTKFKELGRAVASIITDHVTS
jgi:hypothetical protein